MDSCSETGRTNAPSLAELMGAGHGLGRNLGIVVVQVLNISQSYSHVPNRKIELQKVVAHCG